MDNRAHELVEAIRGTANGASARAERFARIGPFMIEAGGGPLAGYVSARPWREGDGGTGAVLRRCAVAERAGGASGLVLFHCAGKLTLPDLRGFLAAALASLFVYPGQELVPTMAYNLNRVDKQILLMSN